MWWLVGLPEKISLENKYFLIPLVKKRWWWSETMASVHWGLCWLMSSSTKQAQLLAGWFVLPVEKTTWLMLVKYLEAVMLSVGGFLLLQAAGRLSLLCPLVFPLPHVLCSLACLLLSSAMSQEQHARGTRMKWAVKPQGMDWPTLCTLQYPDTVFV